MKRPNSCRKPGCSSVPAQNSVSGVPVVPLSAETLLNGMQTTFVKIARAINLYQRIRNDSFVYRLSTGKEQILTT